MSNATLRKGKQRETEAKKRAGNKERKQTERAKKRETKLIIQERKTLKRERQKRWRENKKKLIATENCDEDAVTVSNDFEFPNRMSKCRLLQKHKSC